MKAFIVETDGGEILFDYNDWMDYMYDTTDEVLTHDELERYAIDTMHLSLYPSVSGNYSVHVGDVSDDSKVLFFLEY